jgi:hypothetical protein
VNKREERMHLQLGQALDIIEGMLEAYCPVVGLGHHHDYVGATEDACELLADMRPDKWLFASWGLIRRPDQIPETGS